MTVIDHRILIPKSPEKVWSIVSDLTRNTSWQTDCSNVTLLTSKRVGPNVRWRYVAHNGREYVMEITAWYDGLGYEYRYVDGAPFNQSQGRIRLQEIAEGTVIQWTLNYEIGGVLGGVRNAVGLRRQIESVMVDSLRKLWIVVKESSVDDKPREAKSLMRDAPEYEARIQYRSRFDSPKSGSVDGLEKLPEPPVADEDTRPHIVVSPADEPLLPTLTEEGGDSSGKQPADVASVSMSQTDETEHSEDFPLAQLNLAGEGKTEQPISTVTFEVMLPTTAGPILERDTSKLDTAEISVFDLFGVPRPGQPLQLETIVAPQKREQKRRSGLRIVLRHRHIRVRRTGLI